MARGKRRLAAVFVMTACPFVFAGCHRSLPPRSDISVADLKTSGQLTSGFYWVEGNSWRWTARQFTVGLKPPERSAGRGTTLLLSIYVPEVQIRYLKKVTLHAAVNGFSLSAESYSAPGPYEYRRPVPPEALETNLAPIRFCLDKAVPPAPPAEGRELGVVVSRIALLLNP